MNGDNTLASILTASSESGQLVNYTYSDTIEQEVLTSNFGNGQSIVYEYDDGAITAIKLGEETKYGYEYLKTTDEYGEIADEWTELTDYVSGLKKIIEDSKTTVNDLNGNFIYSVEDVSDDYDGKKITVGSDVYSLATEENKDTFKTNGTTDFEKTYTYSENNDLTKVETAGLTTSFEYNADKFISVLENTLNDVSKAYGYTYDDNGNITTETVTTKDSDGNVIASESVTYVYDDKEQLISAETSTTRWNYSYDDRGNILTKSETDLISNATVTDTYVYETVWKDKLISYNNQTITYDSAGNPTSYLGNTLTWSMGRQLASFGDITYTYNEEGIRTSKTSNGVTTKFYLDGTRIIEQTDGATTLYFFYDLAGEVVGFKYNNDNYIYVKNSMGDIVGIADVDSTLITSYTYDAWGKILSITGSNVELGNLNPFRYRSYYFDTETEFYYLQSRYYDPEIGRFINCDDVSYIGFNESKISYNPFTYCENTPIGNADIYGFFKGRDHYNETYRLAKLYFAEDVARLLGDGSKAVDELFPPVVKAYDEYTQSFHFNINESYGKAGDSRIERSEEMYGVAIESLNIVKKYDEKLKTDPNNIIYRVNLAINLIMAIVYFGMSMHPLQDQVAHCGPGGDMPFTLSYEGLPTTVIFRWHWFWGVDDLNAKYPLDERLTKREKNEKVTIEQLKKIKREFMKRGLYSYVK